MHARVVHVQIKPGKTEEATRIYRDLVPALKQQRGFKSALLLTAPGADKGISVTLWESAADIKATDDSGFYKENLAKFGQVFAATPTREIFEVSLYEVKEKAPVA